MSGSSGYMYELEVVHPLQCEIMHTKKIYPVTVLAHIMEITL